MAAVSASRPSAPRNRPAYYRDVTGGRYLSQPYAADAGIAT